MENYIHTIFAKTKKEIILGRQSDNKKTAVNLLFYFIQIFSHYALQILLISERKFDSKKADM